MIDKTPIYKEVKSVLERVRIENEDDRLMDKGDKLVVAVSGGPDSLALLHLLSQSGLYRKEKLVVAHLDHELRSESAGEAAYVAETAARWGLTFRLAKSNVAELARRKGLSVEEAGRRARYRFLVTVAEQAGAPVIATAHNADDQVETVLMHFLRGAGLAGLRGMATISRVPGAPDRLLIRPLLNVRRSYIEAYCQAHELKPTTDISNEDQSFFRNRIRHELMPMLREYSPGIDERIANMAELLAADYDLLDEQLEASWPKVVVESGQGWLRFDRARWLSLPKSLRRLTLRQAVRHLKNDIGDVGFRSIEQARQVAESGNVGAESVLPGRISLTVGYEHFLLVTQKGMGAEFNSPQLQDESAQKLSIPGRLILAQGWSIEVSPLVEVDMLAVTANRDPWIAYISVGNFNDVIVRPRMKGEWFQPMGMGGRKAKVSKVMIDRKIPAGARARWPIVANARHLLWLVGHHLDERGHVSADSRLVLRLRVVPPARN
jgi:tRNA(Ile)-lysidine synthase